ncbi:MAG: ATP-dependent helicase [Planctomycetota bacterium]|jgi:DNA helicase-2/ATP-dependent DNA helicase PcrA
MAEAHFLDELNPAQRKAVTAGDGPVLVIAGAGTGKTRTLATRVAWLIEKGVPAERILLLTFTRRAAAEMLARAGRIAGSAASRVWGGTFHATANRLLRLYGKALGLSPDFTVMDQADAADVMNLIRSDLGFSKSKKRFPRKRTLINIYSRMVNSRTKLGKLVREDYPWCREAVDGMRQIFERYTARKREHNVLDYDDLLLYWLALLGEKDVAAKVAGRFDHVLVDEYQDTNLVQAEILLAMRRENRNVMVVGDDAQSIYSFRAATVRNILDFPRQFEGTEVVTLEQNYRSLQPILDAANAVMDRAAERFTKNLFSQRGGEARPRLMTCLDEAEQCEEVCRRVLEKYEEGVPLREQAVLFRAGHHSDQLEVELARRNIPFVKYGGLKFVEAAHVKDMIAVLRILENPVDQLSWYRVLLLLQGIGPVTARKIMAGLGLGGTSGEEPAAPGSNPLKVLAESPPRVPPAARGEFETLRAALADCSVKGIPPASQVERIRKFYAPVFERSYDNPTVRVRDLEQLELIADGYRSRSRFITDLTLDPPSSTADLAGPPLLDEDWLVLSTVHSAKGCEWDAVHVIHAADGMIPSDMSTGSAEEIEEERRLLYVAMTRPRDELNIYFPLRYYHRGKGLSDAHVYAQLTRFLAGLEEDLLERVSSPQVREEEESADEDTAEGPPASVDELLGDLLSD